MGVASRTGSDYPFRIHEFTQIFSSIAQSLVYVVFCRSLFVLLCVHLWFTSSNYPFSILWLLHCVSISNIPVSPAYGVYISQLIRYARASGNYSDFGNVIFIWETGYWTRPITRFALFDLLKSLYSDTKILLKYIPSLQKRL